MDEQRMAKLKDRIAKLEQIEAWCDAYPLAMFPEPDWTKVRALLEAGGVPLGSVCASNMRHVIDGIRHIIQRKE